MSDDKIKGKVKWYSIRKGFGFITPSSDNAPTEEDIFFHQTSIVSDVKNKFLETDYEVEFEVYTDDAGKYKSKNVTKPGGDPCEIPERKPRRRGRGKGDETTDDEDGKTEDEGGDTTEEKKDESKNGQSKGGGRGRNNRNRGRGTGDGAEKKEGESGDDTKNTGGRGRNPRNPRKRFDDDISVDVKSKMKEKKLDMRQTSLLLVLEESRIKFGPDGYAALAHADGIMAEGTFACDDEGKVSLTWKSMLKFADGEWKTEDPIANTSSGVLVSDFNWTDENVKGLKEIETPESLWGDDKTDPADALLSNNFQMRKCFLAKTPVNPRQRRRPRPRGNRKGAAAAGDEKAAENAENAESGKMEENSTEKEAEKTETS